MKNLTCSLIMPISTLPPRRKRGLKEHKLQFPLLRAFKANCVNLGPDHQPLLIRANRLNPGMSQSPANNESKKKHPSSVSILKLTSSKCQRLPMRNCFGRYGTSKYLIRWMWQLLLRLNGQITGICQNQREPILTNHACKCNLMIQPSCSRLQLDRNKIRSFDN